MQPTTDTPETWKCSVCGYVATGDTPPENCPVCGVPRDKFDPWEPEPEPKHQAVEWKCPVCGYRHKGDEPPDICPVCGVTKDKFEPVTDESSESSETGTKETIAIIGGGIAGISAAEEARSNSSSAEILLISKEPHLPYYRLNLTRYLAGEINDDMLPVHPESWYSDNRIKLMTGAEVTAINSGTREITLKNGDSIRYDKLILTAGSHPFIPPVPGSDMKNVTSLRTVDDANYILKQASNASSVVIVGGGILGLETAAAIARAASVNVTVVEGFGYLMPRQLNRKASAHLMAHVERLGVGLETDTSVNEINGDGKAESVTLKNGKILDADLVIFAAGVRANSYLARFCGLKVNQGIIVNDVMETSITGIYAAGDITEHRGILYGVWNAAMYQGKIAGMNAAGRRAEFGGIPRSNTLKVLGIDLFSIGDIEVCDGSCVALEKEESGTYIWLLFRDGRIKGAIFYGDTTKSADIKKAIEDKKDYSFILPKNPSVDDILNL